MSKIIVGETFGVTQETIDCLLKRQPVVHHYLRHTTAANQQAFDNLYIAFQEIGTILQRGIKAGEKGHKKALQDAMAICRSIE